VTPTSVGTFTSAVSHTTCIDEVFVLLRPGHVIDGAVIIEVRDTSTYVEAFTEHGDPMVFRYEDTFTAREPHSFHPTGLGKWDACPTCYQGGFAPRHKASSGCKSGSRAHCTCDVCF
jgi:hypothetical protein